MKVSYPLRFNLALVFLVVLVQAKHRPSFPAGPWKPGRATFYGNPDGSGTFGLNLAFNAFLRIFIVDVDAQPEPWKPGRATFYGDPDGSGTFEGTCGYVNAISKDGVKGYGLMTAALSPVLFKNGETCGSCYELKCDDKPKGCKGGPPITITATNLCPGDGWCAPPNEHFDLTQHAYLQIAEYKAGVVPIQYRRVPCIREGGIKFTISTTSNPYFLLILIWNVAGAGDIQSVQIKGNKGKPFMDMKRNWGENWETRENLVGQSLTFRIKSSDGKVSTSWNMVPADWKFGQTYEGKNFN